MVPPVYSLPPDKLARAIEFAHSAYALHFGSVAYAIVVLAAIIRLGVGVRFRDWAERISKYRFVQALVFVPLFLGTYEIAYLPMHAIGQHLELKFGQSIQSWPSWLLDWAKAEALEIVVAAPLAYLLYVLMRRSPRRWWFYFWAAMLPLIFGAMYVEPVIVEPMFYQFEPLAKAHPELVGQLEKLVARGGLTIPPDRMFEMKASDKLNSLNAYVSGFGASERVVVWDTTLEKLGTPEVLSVFGHEMGHYVLGHIRNSLLWAVAALFVALWAGSRVLHWMIGGRSPVRDAGDWASAPLLLLIFVVFNFLGVRIGSDARRGARGIGSGGAVVPGDGRDRIGRTGHEFVYCVLALHTSSDCRSIRVRTAVRSVDERNTALREVTLARDPAGANPAQRNRRHRHAQQHDDGG